MKSGKRFLRAKISVFKGVWSFCYFIALIKCRCVASRALFAFAFWGGGGGKGGRGASAPNPTWDEGWEARGLSRLGGLPCARKTRRLGRGGKKVGGFVFLKPLPFWLPGFFLRRALTARDIWAKSAKFFNAGKKIFCYRVSSSSQK